jgi:hypothetical protein
LGVRGQDHHGAVVEVHSIPSYCIDRVYQLVRFIFGETKRLTVDDKLHPFVVVLMLADIHQVPVTIQGQLGCASNHVYSPQKGISSSQQLHPAWPSISRIWVEINFLTACLDAQECEPSLIRTKKVGMWC